MKRSVIHIPALVFSLVGFTLLGAGTVGLHRWQLARIASGLLAYAEAAERDAKWHKAAEFFDRYLRIKPAEAPIRSRLALTYAKGAQSPSEKLRAVELCYRAVGADHAQDEQELRSKLADLLIEVGRFLEAEQEARKLLELNAEGSDGHRAMALALFAQLTAGSLHAERIESEPFVAKVEMACEKNPHDFVLVEIAGTLLREHPTIVQNELPEMTEAERFARADAHFDTLLRNNPDDANAYLARYRYRTRNKLPESELDLQRALLLAPLDPQVLLTAAVAALRRGQDREKEGAASAAAKEFLTAKAHFATLVREKLLESSSEPHLGLGDASLQAGDLPVALNAWREGLRIFQQPSQQVIFHGRIADALLEAGRDREAAEAMAAIDKILARVGSSVSQEMQEMLLQTQDLRHASLAMKQSKFQDAIPRLQRVVSRQAAGNRMEIEFYAWSQLGRAYASVDEWQESAVAFDRAAAAQPQAKESRLAAAQAWLKAGRPDTAADRAELALAGKGSLEAWLVLAAAQFQLQIRSPLTERSWNRLEAALGALGQAPDDAPLVWRADLLKAEYLAFRGRQEGQVERGRKEAKVVLDQAAEKHSQDVEFMVRLSGILQSLEFPSQADQVLERMRAQKMPAADIALAETRLCLQRKEYSRAQAILEAASITAGPGERLKLRRELLLVAEASGDRAQVERLLDAELTESPSDLRLLRQRCELALERKDAKSFSHWRSKLSTVGTIGSLWAQYYGIMQLYLSSENASDSKLTQALAAQEALAAVHPNWPRSFILRGMIEERRENWEQAIAAYESAIQLGVSQTNVFERLIVGLERLGRSAEAEKYLSRLESYLPFSQQLTEFASGHELRRDPHRAVDIARAAVEKRPRDPQARVWLGRLLLLNKQFQEAEQEMKLAVENSPEDVRAWNGLFSFYVRTGSPDKARATLSELAAKAKLGQAERDFIVAQGLESLGDWDRAGEKYRAAAEQSPQNALIQLRLAGLYLRSDPLQAMDCLRQAVLLDPQLAPARRMLAALLASRGTPAEMQEAEQLLSQIPSAKATVPVEDRRLKALLLAQQGNEENTTRAIQLLEEIVTRGTGSVPGDHLVLAQLYEQESRRLPSADESAAKLKAARQQLVTLAARDKPQPSHLIALLEFLLRTGQGGDVPSWLQKLESAVPGPTQSDPALMERLVELRIRHGSFKECEPWLRRIVAEDSHPVRSLLLQAKFLAAQSKLDEAVALVEPQALPLVAAADDAKTKLGIVKPVGDFYSNVGLHAQAEAWYRRLAELDEQQFPLVIMAVARQKRAEDAIQLCLRLSETDRTSRYAVIAAAVLSELSPARDIQALAEPLLQSALKSYPEDLNLLYSVGTLYVAQERYEESMSIFQKIVVLNPRHVPALNNLALILAESPNKRREALALIDRAIAVVGPHPGLLDTKGAILVYDGKSQQALPLLEVAARGSQVDPRHNLHLAAAYRATANSELARNALQLALDGALEDLILTRTDQDLLDDLRSKLGL